MHRSHPAPRAGSPPPGNLPLELNVFVGRSAELGRLDEALRSARLVTVTGMGGVGKGANTYHLTKAAAWAMTNGVRLELAEQGTLV
ncbi:hypothetical protein ABZS63_06325, partial [Streptomyces sp. NPDC005568]